LPWALRRSRAHGGQSIFDHDHPTVIAAAGREAGAVIDLVSTCGWMPRRWRTCRGDHGLVIGPNGALLLSWRRQVLLAAITHPASDGPIWRHAHLRPSHLLAIITASPRARST
jgi:hypothetical protein